MGKQFLIFSCCCLELFVPIYTVGNSMVLCPSSREPRSISFSSPCPLQKPEKRPPRQFQSSFSVALEGPLSGGFSELLWTIEVFPACAG